MKLLESVLQRSASELIRVACVLSLGGLGVMAFAVISRRALPVMLGMSLGHALGGAAIACYFLAIIADTMRPSAREARAARREKAKSERSQSAKSERPQSAKSERPQSAKSDPPAA